VLDLDSADGRAAYARLAARTDVILDGLGPGVTDALGIGYDVISPKSGNVIYARLTPFGLNGPWRDYASSDLVQLALGGVAGVTGYDDRAENLPIAPGGGQAAHLGSMLTAIGIMGALVNREACGKGQLVDVATHDVIATSLEYVISFWVFMHANVQRRTGRHALVAPSGRQVFRCRDGKYLTALMMYVDDEKQFGDLVAWMASYGLADDLAEPKYASQDGRRASSEHIAKVVEGFCAQLDSDELFHGAQIRRLPWAPINHPADVLHDPHLRDRGALVSVAHPELNRDFIYPGAPYRMSETPWRIRSRAPLLGEDTEEILATLGYSREAICLLMTQQTTRQ
jgi:benzylsuccinate CoA-transferase BbsE subunit